MKRFKTVDEFILGTEQFRDELIKLREILNSTDLEETVKWGAPCYTSAGKNVVGIGAFQSYFGLWFFQGALIDDKNNVLINAGEGKTKALRQWRMTSAKEIKPRVIKSYVKAAIQIVVDGTEIWADVLRVGRLALFWRTPDTSRAGSFDPAAGAWIELDRGDHRAISRAMEIAARMRPIEVIGLPLGRIER